MQKSKMRSIFILCITLLFYSCFPVQIAPKIENYKITKGKKFKRSLPKSHSYIFEDYKNANEFYYYINTKFQRDHQYAEDNTPIIIDHRTYYLSFYEVEKNTKIVNLTPALINGVLENKGLSPVLNEEKTVSRNGTWYIALVVQDAQFNDALNPKHREQKKVVAYLNSLKTEYFTTTNYYSAYLRNKLDTN